MAARLGAAGGLCTLVGAVVGWALLRSGGVSEVSPAGDDVAHALPLPEPAAGDWPWWRGPGRDGAGRGRPPVRWSEFENVAWKAPVPGLGHSSPVVSGPRVLVTSADESAGSVELVCFDRADGRVAWRTPIYQGALPARHEKNSHASATPACDGEFVFCPYATPDALCVAAVDLDGRVCWRAEAGPFVSQWGYGSSPVLYGSLVIVAGDNKGGKLTDLAAVTSHLTALHRRTGEVVWRVRRPREFSYGTPTVATVAGRPQLLLAGAGRVCSYDPATGRELWHCRWSAGRTAGTVAADAQRVYASTTIPGPELVGVRADGSGDVTDTHVAWRLTRGAGDVPSPLRHGGHLHVVTDAGLACCYRADTGEKVFQERLGGGGVSASPVVAGGHVYAAAEDGRVHVYGADPPFRRAAVNRLPGGIFATPAAAGDELFIRTTDHLYCVRGTGT